MQNNYVQPVRALLFNGSKQDIQKIIKLFDLTDTRITMDFGNTPDQNENNLLNIQISSKSDNYTYQIVVNPHRYLVQDQVGVFKTYSQAFFAKLFTPAS